MQIAAESSAPSFARVSYPSLQHARALQEGLQKQKEYRQQQYTQYSPSPLQGHAPPPLGGHLGFLERDSCVQFTPASPQYSPSLLQWHASPPPERDLGSLYRRADGTSYPAPPAHFTHPPSVSPANHLAFLEPIAAKSSPYPPPQQMCPLQSYPHTAACLLHSGPFLLGHSETFLPTKRSPIRDSSRNKMRVCKSNTQAKGELDHKGIGA